MFTLFIFPCFHSCIVYTVLWIGFPILNISSLFLKIKSVLHEFVNFIKTSWYFKRYKCYKFFFFFFSVFVMLHLGYSVLLYFGGRGGGELVFWRVLLFVTES